MSIWKDIHQRSCGTKIRKEDNSIQGVNINGEDLLGQNQVTFVGTIDSKGIPSGLSPQTGQILYITEDCTYGKKGNVIIYTGSSWQEIYMDNDVRTTQLSIDDLRADTGIFTPYTYTNQYQP